MNNIILIVEGTDNSGKDTLINNIRNHYQDQNIDVIHFEKPRSKDNYNAALEQNESFIAYANMLNEVSERFIIFNRAWYGEYVYGTLYRGRTKESVENIINYCESLINQEQNNIVYVQLYTNDSEFLEKNDDGQSLSEGKKEIIEEEKKLFLEIFDKSNIKKKIKINVVENGKFIDQFKIRDMVIELIENN